MDPEVTALKEQTRLLLQQVTTLTDQVSALLGRRDSSLDQQQNWIAGLRNGGPNKDGYFPVSDSTGFVRLLPSPDKLISMGLTTPVSTFVQNLGLLTSPDADSLKEALLSVLGNISTGPVSGAPMFPAEPTRFELSMS